MMEHTNIPKKKRSKSIQMLLNINNEVVMNKKENIAKLMNGEKNRIILLTKL
jgi:hypothetical protein